MGTDVIVFAGGCEEEEQIAMRRRRMGSPTRWERAAAADRVKKFVRKVTLSCGKAKFTHTLESVRSVTANIGWYVVSIIHDQPSCNVDITWPVKSIMGQICFDFRSDLCFSIFVSILHDWRFM